MAVCQILVMKGELVSVSGCIELEAVPIHLPIAIAADCPLMGLCNTFAGGLVFKLLNATGRETHYPIENCKHLLDRYPSRSRCSSPGHTWKCN
jgi:hypothetical protein